MSTFLILIILSTSLIQHSFAQKLTFPNVLSYEKKQNHTHNWHVDGIVKLTEADLIMFEPSLEVHTCSKICTIDLSKCELEEEISSSTTCFCKRISHDEVSVRIGGLASSAHSGQMLQAVVPSRAAFKPITATHVIGRVPSLTDVIVSFTKTPEDIQVGLTRTMSIKCDVMQSDGKPKSVTSLTISRTGNEQVAKVSTSDAAKALADFASLKVEGSVAESSTGLGYIELIWENPSEKQIGQYECLVNAVNDDGHEVTMSSMIEIGVSTPTMDQLVNRIRELELRENSTIESLLRTTTRQRQLEKERESAKTELSHVKQSTTQQINGIVKSSKAQMDEMKAQNLKILKDLATLQSHVKENSLPRHVETGNARCQQDSNTWTKKPNIRGSMSIDDFVRINFKKPYKRPPMVMQSISILGIENTHHTRIGVYMDKVDQHGFTAICHTWGDSHVADMHFTWISVSTDE